MASLSASAKGIISGIRRDFSVHPNRNRFCLFAYEIDYFADEGTTDAEARQDLLVFK
jgi:hypothetical protein